MRNPCLEAALRELEAAGVRNVERAYGSKHLQLRWAINGHPRRMYSMPVTPSDVRAAANTRTGIRRLLRMDGAIAAPAPRKAVRAAEPARPVSEPACRHRLGGEIDRHGIAAVRADIESVANAVEAAIAKIVDTPVAAAAGLELGANPISSIIQISTELRDALASMRRAVSIARALAALPPKEEVCKP